MVKGEYIENLEDILAEMNSPLEPEMGEEPYKRRVTAENWKPEHSRILVHKLKGWHNRDVAKFTKLSLSTVKNVIASPYFKQRLTEEENKLTAKLIASTTDIQSSKVVLEEAKNILVSYAIDAVKKMVQLAASGESKERIQLEAAQAILDRAGLPKKEVVEHISRNYTPEEIESAKNTLLEIESITARVSTTQSRFIIRPPEPDKVTDAPREVLPTSSD